MVRGDENSAEEVRATARIEYVPCSHVRMPRGSCPVARCWAIRRIRQKTLPGLHGTKLFPGPAAALGRVLACLLCHSAGSTVLQQCRRMLKGPPRARQVLLGHPYDVAIDMWSLGCMAAELFLGLPLFPGACEHDLLCHIVDMLGAPPAHVLAGAAHTSKYFRCLEEAAEGGERRTRYHVRSCVSSGAQAPGASYNFKDAVPRSCCPAAHASQHFRC